MTRRPPKVRLGWAGYVGILAALKAQPMALPQMPAVMGIGKDTLYRLVPSLHALGWVHISGWIMLPKSTMPLYAFGPGDDAEPPTRRPNGRRTATRVLREQPASEVISFSTMLHALDGLRASISEVAEEIGAHRDTVSSALDALVAAEMAHLCAWQPRAHGRGGAPIALYTLGAGKPAKKPSLRSRRLAAGQRWRAMVKRRAEFDPLIQALRPAANSETREAA